MRALINNTDIRNYRQLGKQINSDNFTGHVNEIQENQLTELLSPELIYDLFNYLDNNWNSQAGTFTRTSDYVITATGIDLSAWAGYSLRINNSVFVIVETAVFGGADTVITVTGYVLPTTLTTITYKTDNYYVKLLNGTVYTVNGNNINYNGLRPFLAWNFLLSYLVDGSFKQNDVGNFKITGDLFQTPSGAQINQIRSAYLENSLREQNRISEYLNENNTTFPLWTSKNQDKNLTSFDWIVI